MDVFIRKIGTKTCDAYLIVNRSTDGSQIQQQVLEEIINPIEKKLEEVKKKC